MAEALYLIALNELEAEGFVVRAQTALGTHTGEARMLRALIDAAGAPVADVALDQLVGRTTPVHRRGTPAWRVTKRIHTLREALAANGFDRDSIERCAGGYQMSSRRAAAIQRFVLKGLAYA